LTGDERHRSAPADWRGVASYGEHVVH